MTVAIVTDSTADLPDHLIRKWDISIVPLYVNFKKSDYGNDVESLRDGFDIDADLFYEKLNSTAYIPTTSQPTVDDFLQQYRILCQDHEKIISIHISSKLSGTINSALLARAQLEDPQKVDIVDSNLVSMGLGLAVIAGAEAASAGLAVSDILQKVHESCSETQIYFVVDTLEYLHKGGRIGKAQALFGTLLSVRPILSIRDGEIYPVERVRTKRKAIKRLASLVIEGDPFSKLCLMFNTNREDISELEATIAGSLRENQLIISRIGPVIGTHCGPGLIGVAARRSVKSPIPRSC